MGGNLKDDKVCVIHILGVNPDYQRKGLAKEVMNSVIDFAKATGKKAVRLDAFTLVLKWEGTQ